MNKKTNQHHDSHFPCARARLPRSRHVALRKQCGRGALPLGRELEARGLGGIGFGGKTKEATLVWFSLVWYIIKVIIRNTRLILGIFVLGPEVSQFM